MIQLDYENILPDIEKLIESDNRGALLNILVDLHPADIEEILNRLKKEQRKYVFNLLPSELASDVLPELDTPVVEQVLEDASEEKITDLVDRMDSDDAADLIGDLPEEVAEKVLDQMEDEASHEVQELLHHAEDTAGGIMALEFVAMPETATVNETIEAIREARDEVEDLYAIWVVDENQRLIGSVSLTDLVLAKGYTTLREIMDVDVPYVRLDMDQEEVANFFKKYDLVSAPVVDENMRLVGRITVDDVVDVLEEEGSEDLAYLAGAPDEEVLEDSAFVVSKARIPWLMVAFFGEIAAAFILNSFEVTLKQKVMAAFFIPIVMAMGGSTGQQSSVITVRGLATGDINIKDTGSRLLKEFRVSLINSLFFSALIFGIVYLWDGMQFATILAASMFIVINNAAIVGALVPLMFKKLNIDPALSAAPLVSVSNDVIGLIIYLSITTIFLNYFY
ncbi:MAG TPA: magnesium transporter [Caldithrix abyssi]|uniref:Magnesium transporter MgtE n=1 Tax=Caldithrix abyssi TaxID=187145 RepID=A0A7V4WW66_CALAY|nr:magnesium transporter [Caldithrix abyssi]